MYTAVFTKLIFERLLLSVFKNKIDDLNSKLVILTNQEFVNLSLTLFVNSL